jgi:hypothetical protein
MLISRWIHHWVVPRELRLAGRLSSLRRVPLLRYLVRRVTARLKVRAEVPGGAMTLHLDFETPYLHLPVEVEKAQIGTDRPPDRVEPASFRFFDWHSWQHIDGQISWLGEQEVSLGERRVELVRGFTYSVDAVPSGAGHLGLRIAEGVEGAIRVRCGDELACVGFEPGYWMLEPLASGYRQVAICKDELMVLIVSLSEIGSGNAETHRRAVEHLWTWVSFHLGRQEPVRALRRLVQVVKEWGPLSLAPLYQGLKVIVQRLEIPDAEQILFELYADHWGVHGDRDARVVVIKTLDALGTEAARSALCDLFAYVRNRVLDPEERALLEAAAQPRCSLAEVSG